MGNKLSQQKVKCFEEIKFLITSFKQKYENYQTEAKDKILLPKYGLDYIIEELSNKKKKWLYLNEFYPNLQRWIYDTEFILLMQQFNMKQNQKDIYISFINDTKDLQQKIIEVVDKFSYKDKLKL